MTSRVAAIIPAAGLGLRLAASADSAPPESAPPESAPQPKALRPLAGRSLLERSAVALADHVGQLVVAAPAERLDDVRRELFALPVPVAVVPGGATRQDSVRRALDAVSPDHDLVLVHDAARPLVPPDVVTRVVEALLAGAEVVVPVLEVADSLRRVDGDGTNRPIDRTEIRVVQTPQGFGRDVLTRAHLAAHDSAATDDASLVERLGLAVHLVAGDPLAFKITRPFDLVVAEAVLAGQ